MNEFGGWVVALDGLETEIKQNPNELFVIGQVEEQIYSTCPHIVSHTRMDKTATLVIVAPGKLIDTYRHLSKQLEVKEASACLSYSYSDTKQERVFIVNYIAICFKFPLEVKDRHEFLDANELEEVQCLFGTNTFVCRLKSTSVRSILSIWFTLQGDPEIQFVDINLSYLLTGEDINESECS